MNTLALKLEKWLKHHNRQLAAWRQKRACLLLRKWPADKDSHLPSPSRHLSAYPYLPVRGGHVAGSVEVYDPLCRKLAQASQHITI